MQTCVTSSAHQVWGEDAKLEFKQSVSQQEIDARKMRKDEVDKKLQDIADDVVRSMLEAQVRGAVGASKDTKEDRMEEGILKTEWNPGRYKPQDHRSFHRPRSCQQ